LVLIG
jgi:hypothetical protein